MFVLNRARALECLSRYRLTAPNWKFADYWLSCWTEDGKPRHVDKEPFIVHDVMDNTLTTRVRPDVSAIGVAAGSRIRHLFGADSSGRDWLAALPEELRVVHLDCVSRVARGAVACDHRHVVAQTGEMYYLQSLILPFGEFDQDGSRTVITHVDTTPLGSTGRIKSRDELFQVPQEHRITKLI